MREYYTNCCDARFLYPDWPDNDICTKCGEHADLMGIIGEDNENNKK